MVGNNDITVDFITHSFYCDRCHYLSGTDLHIKIELNFIGSKSF